MQNSMRPDAQEMGQRDDNKLEKIGKTSESDGRNLGVDKEIYRIGKRSGCNFLPNWLAYAADLAHRAEQSLRDSEKPTQWSTIAWRQLT